MAIFNRKPRNQRPEQLTPWERYQQRVAHNQEQEQRRHFNWSGRRIRIGDKLPQLKNQRQRSLVRRSALLIGLFTLGLLIAGYFISPLSHIQRVTITGTDRLTRQQVMHATSIQPGGSVWAFVGHDQRVSRRANAANPQIASVTTQLTSYNQVKVTVHEIKVAGYLVNGDYYQRVLENGQILTKQYSQPGGGSPIYANFKSGERLKTMIAQYAKLPAAVKHAISEIKFAPSKENAARVHLYMNDGNEVYATISTFAKKMTYYPGIVAKMKSKGIINLEVGAYSYSFKK